MYCVFHCDCLILLFSSYSELRTRVLVKPDIELLIIPNMSAGAPATKDPSHAYAEIVTGSDRSLYYFPRFSKLSGYFKTNTSTCLCNFSIHIFIHITMYNLTELWCFVNNKHFQHVTLTRNFINMKVGIIVD